MIIFNRFAAGFEQSDAVNKWCRLDNITTNLFKCKLQDDNTPLERMGYNYDVVVKFGDNRKRIVYDNRFGAKMFLYYVIIKTINLNSTNLVIVFCKTNMNNFNVI